MVGRWPRLLRAVSASALVAVGVASAGCSAWLRPSRSVQPSSRSLQAPLGRALVVVLSEASGAMIPAMTRILDEDAEAVADVPDGSHAVFEATAGEHVYAAFTHELPLEDACVGALRARLEAGRTYAFRIEKSETLRVWKRTCNVISLTAVRGDELSAVLSGLSPRLRVELVPQDQRSYTFAEDVDLRESVVGTAKLRMSPLARDGEVPIGWSADANVLRERDGMKSLR